MEPYRPYIEKIPHDQDKMVDLLCKWANINSWSENLEGLANMLSAIQQTFAQLNGKMEALSLPSRVKIDRNGHPVEVPNGQAFRMTKHPKAPLQVLLAGHMDTVYPPNSAFQKTEKIDDDTMRGPGVADMKGGLIILLKAL